MFSSSRCSGGLRGPRSGRRFQSVDKFVNALGMFVDLVDERLHRRFSGSSSGGSSSGGSNSAGRRPMWRVTVRADVFGREDEFVATGADLKLASARSFLVVARKFGPYALAAHVFDDDVEAPEVERQAGRLRDLHDPLAQALLGEFTRTVMAERIVSTFVAEPMGHPGAAAAADVPVVAGAAKTFGRCAVVPGQRRRHVGHRLGD